jgi:hypothetical protein
MRTQPMSSEMLCSGSLVPRANSVEPPPMSSVRNGARLAGSPAVAPANASAASAPPDSNSGALPTARRTRSKNSSRFFASRAALVPVTRTRRVACCTSMAP